MTNWTNLEKAWLCELMVGVVPNSDRASLDLFIPELIQNAPPLFKLGLRFSTWFLYWSPLVILQKPYKFKDIAARDKYLSRLNQSSFYIIRQLVVTIKVAVCFGYFHDQLTNSND